MIELLCERFEIGGALRDAALRAQARCETIAYPAQREVKANVLRAFLDEGLSESDLAGSTGYGYDDAARSGYESLLARIFGVERALARLSIVSGTHAIVTSLAACVPPGSTLLSISGRPYDTLRNAICDAPHSLVQQGVAYREIDLTPRRRHRPRRARCGPRAAGSRGRLSCSARAATRRGRHSRSTRARGLSQRIRRDAPGVAILVDNCYGELVEAREPTHVGADLVMGSLIKNLGGSIAPAGGYVAGRADLVERVASRLYAPGLGRRSARRSGFGRSFVQGLFLAPLVVEQCLRGLDFAAALFGELGYPVDPQPGAAARRHRASDSAWKQ